MKENIFEELRKYSSDDFIFRSEINKLTGGILLPQTMACFDARGEGISNRRYMRRQVIYDIDDVINWLKNNTTLINFDE